MTGDVEQHLAAQAERQTRALEAIKVAVWILASLAIAGAAFAIYGYLDAVLG